MGDETMNKRGAIVLRDIMFMLIIFSAVLALSSVLVLSMSDEYSNTDMRTEYYANDSVGNLGDSMFVNVSSTMETMKNKTESSVDNDDSLLGSFTSVTGVIQGAATILKAIVSSPVYVGEALTTMMVAVNIPSLISVILGNTIIFLIYAIIIFVIVSALLKGGKV